MLLQVPVCTVTSNFLLLPHLRPFTQAAMHAPSATAAPVSFPLMQKLTGSALSGLSSFASTMSEAAARNATQAAAEAALA